jgi:hypothetical protein
MDIEGSEYEVIPTILDAMLKLARYWSRYMNAISPMAAKKPGKC